MPAWNLVVNGCTVHGEPIGSLVDTFKVHASVDGRTEFIGWIRNKGTCWEHRSLSAGQWLQTKARHQSAAALFSAWRAEKTGKPTPPVLTDEVCASCGKQVIKQQSAGKTAILTEPEIVGMLTEDGRRVRGRVYHNCQRK